MSLISYSLLFQFYWHKIVSEMYIQKAEITNIKSIEHFEIEFPNPAGWHVLIGDNGAGKSTIIKSIGLVLVGNYQAQGLRLDWNDWLRRDSDKGRILLDWSIDGKYDGFKVNPNWIYSSGLHKDESIDESKESVAPNFEKDKLSVDIIFERYKKEIRVGNNLYVNAKPTLNYGMTFDWKGFFSCGFGPFRRFEGGSPEMEKLYESTGFIDLVTHLSLFSETVALTEPIKWLKNLNYKQLEEDEESEYTLRNLKKLINYRDKDGSFLQNNAQLESVSSQGVLFKDGKGATVTISQISDGYRSILSLTFELIRQLVRDYGAKKVFNNIEKGEMFIDLPGVVLIDEIDAHLHPTWQTRIGQWFLKYFPKLQFIVTTHSPLVCRAAENGSIWRLASPGSNDKSGEVTGIDRERLIYGNVLDAYGTGVFGENTSISQDSNEMLNRLSELNIKSMMGEIGEKESDELQELKAIFPTENKIELPDGLKK